MKIYIFDLDDTTIDSRHRQLYFLNRKLDLEYWEQNSTRENIFKDELLFLALFMQWLISQQFTVWVLTAREISDYDVEFLKHHKLMPDRIISRAKGDKRPDHLIKQERLEEIIGRSRMMITSEIIFFDDKESNRDALAELGCMVFNPQGLNG